MKKIAILPIAAGLCLAVGSVYGQGSIDLNNFDTLAGMIVQTGPSTFIQAPAGTVVEVLGGASAGSLSPLASGSAAELGVIQYTLTAGDVGAAGAGTGAHAGSGFDYGYAAVAGVAPAGTAFFQVIAWLQGNGSANTFLAAQYKFTSTVFTSVVGSTIVPPAPPTPGSLNIPGNNMVLQAPEPGTIALGGLGAAALLLFRRRK